VTVAIPIRNVFLLFCYAWDQARFGKALFFGTDDPPNFAHLLSRALIEATRQLFRAGVERGYRETEEEVAGVRERIAFTSSLPLIAFQTQRLVCRFSEQSHDTAANRILKAGLCRLASVEGLNFGLSSDLRRLSQYMYGVLDISLRPEAFRVIQIHRHTARYDLILNLCRLIMELGIPSSNGGGLRFADPLADDALMARVFEGFVRNFWRLEAEGFAVAPAQVQIPWDAAPETRLHPNLPVMRADILIRTGNRRIIADTKYYREALVQHFSASKLRSGHLYQLLTYLRNDFAAAALPRSEGMLIYPAVATHIDDRFHLEGHDLRVATVDLDQPWEKIGERMLALLDAPQ
jgi:5-methylcytosine-specific restriction enzyme subunit McrC